MEINYVDYSDNLFREAIDSRKNRIYIFDNFQNLCIAKEHYQKPFLKRESRFLTISDFKEKLFPVNKLMLKEEKLTVLFYELLTEEEKRELNIDTYFDVIELAAEFFRFYRELNDYNLDNIDEIIELRKWQKQKYRMMESIRKRYKKRLEELNYIDQTLQIDLSNFSTEYMREYQEIVFINILYFTPLDKEIFRKIEDSGRDVHLFLQLNEKDFDSKKLRLSGVSLPENPDVELSLQYTDDHLLQLTNMISLLAGGEEYSILDASFGENNYQHLLTSGDILIEKEISFTRTKIYSFLDILYNLFDTADLSGEDIKLELADLLNACYRQEFRDYFNLHKDIIKALHSLAREGFVYITRELIDRQENSVLAGLKSIPETIGRISKFQCLVDFCQYLQQINLETLNDQLFVDNIDQYFDALLELASIEKMNIVYSWQKYFGNRPQGLFRLILNYLSFKSVKKIRQKEKSGVKIRDLFTAPHVNWEQLIILNASSGDLPPEKTNKFLLTDKQRVQLGLKSSQERQIEDKYYFYRHLLSCQRAIVYGLKNMDQNTTISTFVEELQIKYDLPVKEVDINSSYYSTVVKNIFINSSSSLKKHLTSAALNRDRMFIEKDDFSDPVFPLNYYKYGVLTDCYYKFFLVHIAALDEERFIPGRELEPVIIGNLVHQAFAMIVERTGLNFNRIKELTKQVTRDIFSSYNLKINNYYRKYYHDILLPVIQQSIIKFFQIIEKRLEGGAKKVETEWKPIDCCNRIFYSHQLTDVYLNGRIDLFIENEIRKYIIDFKTGKGDYKQLDFYSLLLEDSSKTDKKELEKDIYDVMGMKLLRGRPGTETDFARDISTELEKFFSSAEYRAEYKSRCERCKMIDICRGVIE